LPWPWRLQVKHMLKQSSSWKGSLCIFLLIITLVVLLVLVFKIGHVVT
jgi:hypothetical protein